MVLGLGPGRVGKTHSRPGLRGSSQVPCGSSKTQHLPGTSQASWMPSCPKPGQTCNKAFKILITKKGYIIEDGGTSPKPAGAEGD